MVSPLVSGAELEAHLADPAWLVLDCQHDLMNHAFGRQSYAREHIPGAHFVSMEDDMAGTKTGANGRHPLPAVADLEALFSRLGVTAGTQVVCYDSANNNYAGRVWWTLRWLGHDQVAVLDGGLGKWRADARPTTASPPAARPAAQFAARPRDAMRVEVSTLVGNLGSRRLTVLDARTAERYAGLAEPIDPVAGHIPGALSRPWQQNILPDGTYKSAALLAAEYRALLGSAPASSLVHQCGSGVSACQNLIAMEIAGLAGSRLYIGSWSEWCADPARPVATGPNP